MKRVCYISAVLLIAIWIGSVFFLHVRATTHILVLMAMICWLHGLIGVSHKKYVIEERKKYMLEEKEAA